MSEFKGTKGKWKCTIHMSGDRTHEVRRVDSDNGIAICVIRTNNHDQARSNAQLISKVPEMLEMLKEAKRVIFSMKLSMWVHPDCSKDSEFYDMATTGEETENKIEQLIKEATTI